MWLGSIIRDLKMINTMQLAQKYMPNGTCGVISFGLKGGRQAAARVHG